MLIYTRLKQTDLKEFTSDWKRENIHQPWTHFNRRSPAWLLMLLMCLHMNIMKVRRLIVPRGVTTAWFEIRILFTSQFERRLRLIFGENTDKTRNAELQRHQRRCDAVNFIFPLDRAACKKNGARVKSSICGIVKRANICTNRQR